MLWEWMIADSVRCLAVSHFLIMFIPRGSHLRSIAHEDKKEYSGWNFIEAILKNILMIDSVLSLKCFFDR